MSTAHLPAWQSLGLKLKNQFPQASLAPPKNAFNAETTSQKRKFSQDEAADTESPNGVKRRQQNTISHESGAPSNGTRDSSTGSESQTLSDSRRKSVTFTADTKAEDGCSSKRLVQAAYASRLAQMDHSNGATGKLQDGHSAKKKNSSSTYASSVAQMENGIANVTEEAQNAMVTERTEHNMTDNAGEIASIASEKSAQHKKSKRSSAQPSSKVEVARQKKKQELAIQYLEQYAHARATWKFNKKRQNIVLQMVLEADGIPAEHNEAIESYLAGLQSTASRQKLRSEAREILAEVGDATDPTSIDNTQVLRAKLVLEALGQEAAVPDQDKEPETQVEAGSSMTNVPSKPEPTTTNGTQIHPQANGKIAPDREANGVTKKRRRRRTKKRRNASSSDSDSSSSSDESESDGN